MSYEYSENILVQESVGHLLRQELRWKVAFAYNTEKLGKDGTFGRSSYREILLSRYFRDALKQHLMHKTNKTESYHKNEKSKRMTCHVGQSFFSRTLNC